MAWLPSVSSSEGRVEGKTPPLLALGGFPCKKTTACVRLLRPSETQAKELEIGVVRNMMLLTTGDDQAQECSNEAVQIPVQSRRRGFPYHG